MPRPQSEKASRPFATIRILTVAIASTIIIALISIQIDLQGTGALSTVPQAARRADSSGRFCIFRGFFDRFTHGVIAPKAPLAVKKRVGSVVILADFDARLDEMGAQRADRAGSGVRAVDFCSSNRSFRLDLLVERAPRPLGRLRPPAAERAPASCSSRRRRIADGNCCAPTRDNEPAPCHTNSSSSRWPAQRRSARSKPSC